MTKRYESEVLVALALAAAVVIIASILIFGRQAFGAEVCATAPGGGYYRWLYRIVDGRKCWFPARGLRRGEEKPREELHWPRRAEPEPELVSEPVVEVPLGEFKDRWNALYDVPNSRDSTPAKQWRVW